MPKTTLPTRYTLVRHSAYVVRQDPQFRLAVELRSVEPKEAATVEKVGGLLFEDYSTASDREFAENYPDENKSLIPNARGGFVKRAGIGEIYIVEAH